MDQESNNYEPVTQCPHLGAGLRGEHREDASATAHIQHILVAEEVGVVDDCVPAFMLSRSTVCKTRK